MSRPAASAPVIKRPAMCRIKLLSFFSGLVRAGVGPRDIAVIAALFLLFAVTRAVFSVFMMGSERRNWIFACEEPGMACFTGVRLRVL